MQSAHRYIQYTLRQKSARACRRN